MLTQLLEGFQTYHVSRRRKTPFLTDLSPEQLIDLLEMARRKSSTNLAEWAKLVASFHADTADLIAICSERSKCRARAEAHSVSHLNILVAAFCQCRVGRTCVAIVSPPLILQTRGFFPKTYLAASNSSKFFSKEPGGEKPSPPSVCTVVAASLYDSS